MTTQKKNPVLVIPISETELEDLRNGEDCQWTLTTDKGQDIDVLIRTENTDDNEINDSFYPDTDVF